MRWFRTTSARTERRDWPELGKKRREEGAGCFCWSREVVLVVTHLVLADGSALAQPGCW